MVNNVGLSSSPPGEQDEAFLSEGRLVGERWRRLMQGRVPDLAASVANSLRDTEPGYRSGAVPSAELPMWIGRSGFRVLDGFAVPLTDLRPTLDVPAEVGARRASQGIPPRSLQRAYLLAGKGLTGTLAQWTAAEGTASTVSTTLVNKLWQVLGEHSAAGVDALCRAYDEYNGQHSAGFRLDALLNGDDRQVTTSVASRAFALPMEGRYSVIVRHPMPGGPPVPTDELAPGVQAMRIIWRQHGDSVVGLAVLAGHSPYELRDCLPDHGTCRTGVSTPVEGLASLGQARVLAETAARTLRRPGLAFLADRLDVAMISSRPDLAMELQLHVLAPLLGVEEWRREVLLQTLEVWLDTDGSTALAAGRLYCHRNTVINRLRRIEQMTNRSLSVPKDLISLALALRAYRQQLTG